MQLIHGMTPIEYDTVVAGKYTTKVQNAAKRGIHFNISLSMYRTLFMRKKCAYTGIPLTLRRDDNNNLPKNYATLERIDSKKGYVAGNVVVISHEANSVKAVFENPASGSMDVSAAIRMFANIERLQKGMK
jgi:hypothetical protein